MLLILLLNDIAYYYNQDIEDKPSMGMCFPNCILLTEDNIEDNLVNQMVALKMLEIHG